LDDASVIAADLTIGIISVVEKFIKKNKKIIQMVNLFGFVLN
jgi:hypothetical protein